ncbi:class I SAM-dependent methyltransferase [Neobacillus sp. WH10]|uniref:class I SAM-dependent methyltransferase n=1 Tax=Neobacillus sp. WH10 TaxID=3047873 RepID=UPI0024C180D9|nr:class I SAM-dependent methyltransferase [Neobacillus sp. WH10]WHY78617.1 class I SAM-dependent methyltransferase [Neobacillus sp. WH10]
MTKQYKLFLSTIFNVVMQKKHSRVLDIGFGTGILTSKLYENGHHIDGLDFSPSMISIAHAKMPMANLIEWDISEGLPDIIKENKYDSIISTYELHHLTDEEKLLLIKNLLSLLSENGKILIGDISFQTHEQMETCRSNSINYWDAEEFYFFYEEINSHLQNYCKCEFHPISHCGGVFIISR